MAAATDPGGKFVVVWDDYEDGSGSSVSGQRFNSIGTKLGAEFQVNTYTTSDQGFYGAAVAADGAGNFVVVWTSLQYNYYSLVWDPHRIVGQRFDSAGVKQGAEFQVNTDQPCIYPASCPSYRTRPAVAASAAGDFVVVWESYGYGDPGSGDGSGWGVFGQRFDSAGAKQGGEFQINTYTTGDQGNRFDTVSVASDAAGNFVVVWGSDESYFDVVGQRFDSAGNKAGGEFRTSSMGYVYPKAHVASDSAGNFVVVWNGGYSDVVGQRFDSTGATVGAEFQVNTYTTGDQGYRGLWVASDPAGNFVVTWAGENDTGDYGVSVQQFDSTCATVGGEYQIGPGGGRFSLAAAADAAGNFVVAWRTDDGVLVQHFGDAGSQPCTSLPRGDCRSQMNPRRGAFRFRDPGNPARKSVAWRSPTLEATAFADFADPFTDTDYALCVYDDSTGDQPVLTARMPAGDICNVVPCWTKLSPPGKTIRYLDTLGTPDGINMMHLRAGDEGKARAGLRGRGENVKLPSAALTPPVIVQLQASNSLCFTSRYEGRIRKNEPGDFVGRSGSPSGAFLDTAGTLLE